MRDKIKLIVEQLEHAEKTSALKPAQKMQHIKFALNGAVDLLSEMALKIETLEANSE